jgi:DNA-binding transcriptional regulator YiaG
MSKYNIEKARQRLKAAENEQLREDILSREITTTTAEELSNLEKETGWKVSHFAQYIGYSYNAVKCWSKKNENTRLVSDICSVIKKKYWHKRNEDRFKFEIDE